MELDVNGLRTLLTLVCFGAFIGIVLWAYSGARRSRFKQAACLPLDDEMDALPGEGSRGIGR